MGEILQCRRVVSMLSILSTLLKFHILNFQCVSDSYGIRSLFLTVYAVEVLKKVYQNN